jgi:hypothetical protein
MANKRVITTDYIEGLKTVKDFITNGAAERNTFGWKTYALSQEVTFQDTGDTVTLASHGIANGTTVSYTSITSTTGISVNTKYYVVNATTNTFQVASSNGGSALVLTTNGSGTLVLGKPLNGTGGSPNITWTKTTSNPLTDGGSFLFTKDAANRMGQGVSFDFTVPNSMKAKVLSLAMEYIVSSGTFAAGINGTSGTDSDITIWLYDITNGVLIQPSTYKLYSNSSTLSDNFKSYAQTSSNSTSYRLCIHISNPSTSAFAVMFDNIMATETEYTYGSPVTGLSTPQTPIYKVTGGATNATVGTTTKNIVYWRRVGSEAIITYLVENTTTAGSAGSGGSILLQLPAGLTMDLTNITPYTGAGLPTQGGSAGKGAVIPSFDSCFFFPYDHISGAIAYVYDNKSFRIAQAYGNTVNDASAGLDAATLATSGFGMSITVMVPILGWSSSVQMSDSADTRVVSFVGSKVTGQAVTLNSTKFTFTSIKDSHGAFNGTDTYVVPVAGDYQVSLSVITSIGTYIYAKVNGVKTSYVCSSVVNGGRGVGAGYLPNLKAGDLITIIADTSSTISSSTGDNLSISRLSGPSAIAATETVAASYWVSANFAASNTVPINFDSKEFDTHGAVTTSATAWKFTAPVAGLYQISGFVANTGTTAFVQVYKNGSAYKSLGYEPNTAAATSLSNFIKLNAGDYIDIRPSASSTHTGGSLSATNASNISITKVGMF